MKKTIFISIGILIILLIIATWVYLLMNGRPDSADEVFTQFNTSNNSPRTESTENLNSDNIDDNAYLIDVSPEKLKQLTTRPVSGAVFTEEGIMYVEQGTGYVYEINLLTGEEVILSGTTIPQAFSATFSEGGEYVAITSLVDGVQKTIVGSVMNGELIGKSLPINADNIAFKEDGLALFYTLYTNNKTIGYAYDLETEESLAVFENKLRDVNVVWDETIHIFTTPSNGVEGYVYNVTNNNEYVTNGRVGLSTLRTKNTLLISSTEEAYTDVLDIENYTNIIEFPFIIPEKCASGSTVNSLLYCATPKILFADSYPDDWYKGAVSYNDTITMFDVTTGQYRTLLDLSDESGREIDVLELGRDYTGIKLYFINKNDNTLWLFDRTVE